MYHEKSRKKSKYKLEIYSVFLDQCINGYAAFVSGKLYCL